MSNKEKIEIITLLEKILVLVVFTIMPLTAFWLTSVNIVEISLKLTDLLGLFFSVVFSLFYFLGKMKTSAKLYCLMAVVLVISNSLNKYHQYEYFHLAALSVASNAFTLLVILSCLYYALFWKK